MVRTGGPLIFTFSRAKYEQMMERGAFERGKGHLYTLLFFDVENSSSSNLEIDFSSLIVKCITSNKRQVNSVANLTGHIPEGEFYAGVKQSLGIWFESTLLPEINDGDQFIFEYFCDAFLYNCCVTISENKNTSGVNWMRLALIVMVGIVSSLLAVMIIFTVII